MPAKLISMTNEMSFTLSLKSDMGRTVKKKQEKKSPTNKRTNVIEGRKETERIDKWKFVGRYWMNTLIY